MSMSNPIIAITPGPMPYMRSPMKMQISKLNENHNLNVKGG